MAEIDEEEIYHTILLREQYKEMAEKHEQQELVEDRHDSVEKAFKLAHSTLMQISGVYSWDTRKDGATARQMNALAEDALGQIKGILS